MTGGNNSNNSVLRPSALGQPSNINTQSFDMNELSAQITRIVRDVLTREGPQMISNIINSNSDSTEDVDQTIDTQADRNLADLDRIPDIVKSLREFSGQPGEFSSWKKSVDRILQIYEHLKGTPKYYGILSVVRNKIVGHADIALESYNTPLNWAKMSKCLTLHYADKRDLGTLEYQMTTLVQGTNTVPEFYQSVYQHLSLIMNKLSCMDMSNESLNNMTQAYRDKALDTFVRGLRGDLPRLLSIKEPVDLPQALHLCLKLQNVDFRTQYANSSHHNVPKRQIPPPPIPTRRNDIPGLNLHNSRQQPFYPQLLHNPRVLQNPFPRPFQPFQTFQQNQQSNRPVGFQNTGFQRPNIPFNRPLPKPELMEVDRSIRSRQINYSNRPQNYHPQKRSFMNNSHQAHPPNKFQRVFHTEQNTQETNVTEEQNRIQDENTEQGESYSEPSLDEYLETIDNPNYDQAEELDDIYFLD